MTGLARQGIGSGASFDALAQTIAWIGAVLATASAAIVVRRLVELVRRERRVRDRRALACAIAAGAAITAAVIACVWTVPLRAGGGRAFDELAARLGPGELGAAAAVSVLAGVLGVHAVLLFATERDGERPLLGLACVSLASGVGNTLVLFALDGALNGRDARPAGVWVLWFATGLCVYAAGQTLVRTRLIAMTAERVSARRLALVRQVLDARYGEVERVDRADLRAVLEVDAPTIAQLPNVVVGAVTSAATIVFCLVYLGTISVRGMLASILLLALCSALHVAVARSAGQLWDGARSAQRTLFALFAHLDAGLKELHLHRSTREAFQAHVAENEGLFRERGSKAQERFANVYVLSSVFFVGAIGAAAFVVLPLSGVSAAETRSYALAFLYVSGPIVVVFNAVPELVRIRLAWRRFSEVAERLGAAADRSPASGAPPLTGPLRLELCGVEFRHRGEGRDRDGGFALGPIDCEFHAGEVIFITGGNGSGKSTLAKLLTGLYVPDRGDIRVGARPVHHRCLGELCSITFRDYHLFDRLYGIDPARYSVIAAHLEALRLSNEVRLDAGVFSTLDLSSGQRGRLALLLTYLEDRPVVLFDEWAADQDVEFKHHFYHSLLPDLRRRGKCVIAITHDERYFGVADRVLRMENGKIALECPPRVAPAAPSSKTRREEAS